MKRGSVSPRLKQLSPAKSTLSKHNSQAEATNTLIAHLFQQEQVNIDVLAICRSETLPVYPSHTNTTTNIETTRLDKSHRLVKLSGLMGDKIEMLGKEQAQIVREISRVQGLLDKRVRGIRRLSVLGTGSTATAATAATTTKASNG